MGVIRQNPNTGRYYCDGRECGYSLSFSPPLTRDDPDWDGGCGVVSCPDCWASMDIAWPPPDQRPPAPPA